GVGLRGRGGVGALGQGRGVHRPGAVDDRSHQRLQRRARGRVPRVELDRDRGQVPGGRAGGAAERRRRVVGRAAIGRAGQRDRRRRGIDGEGDRGAEADVGGLVGRGGVGAVGQARRLRRPGVAVGGGREVLNRGARGGTSAVDLHVDEIRIVQGGAGGAGERRGGGVGGAAGGRAGQGDKGGRG